MQILEVQFLTAGRMQSADNATRIPAPSHKASNHRFRFAAGLERNSSWNIAAEGCGQHFVVGNLRCNHEMDSGGTGECGKPCNKRLDLLAETLYQVHDLVYTELFGRQNWFVLFFLSNFEANDE